MSDDNVELNNRGEEVNLDEFNINIKKKTNVNDSEFQKMSILLNSANYGQQADSYGGSYGSAKESEQIKKHQTGGNRRVTKVKTHYLED